MGIRDGNARTLICIHCGEEKPSALFRKEHNTRDRRRQPCKTCDYRQSKQWREQNPERTREQLAEQYYRDPAKQADNVGRWGIKNQELVRAHSRERKRRMRRGQAHWQRTGSGALIGRLATIRKDRTYIKERMRAST